MKETKGLSARAVNPMSASVTIATFAIVVAAIAVCCFLSVRAQQGTIDLNGRWKTSDGQEVVIEQTGQAVKATFVSGGDCPSGGMRAFYFQGSLSFDSLTGTMKGCTRNQQLLQDCNFKDPYDAKIIDARVDRNTITGKYVSDYITYDEKAGHYVNCRIQPGAGTPTAFSLTRSAPEGATRPTPAPATNLRPATKPAPETAGETKAPPIIAMAIASAIDEKGKIVNPRFTFPPDELQITAVVYVGKSSSGQLKVTWYKVSEDEDGKPIDVKLFEHQIRVKSDERAFSVAKNPGGTLERGTYKVVATLEGQTKETEFDISPPKTRQNKTPNDRDDELFENQTHRVSIDSFRGSLQKVAWKARSQTTVAAQAGSATGQGKRPVAGTAGTVPPSASAPAKSPEEKCYMSTHGLNDPERDLGADTVEVFSLGVCPKGVFSLELYATVTGPPKLLGGVQAGTEDVQRAAYFNVDPCWLSGGSDLPGTKITIKTKAVDNSGESPKEVTSMDSVITLGEDTLAPRVMVVPLRAGGDVVKAGDKINLQVTAQEKRRNGPWQTGVRRIWLKTTPEGVSKPDEWNNPSPLRKPCAEKTWEQPLQATYTVPKNPPPIIEICAYADDYADNEGNNCTDFATGEWRGTLREHAEGNLYNETVTVLFSFNEERDGTIKGAGRVKLESAKQRFNDCDVTRTLITPQPLLFPISGKHVDDEFHLELPTDYKLSLSVKTDCPPPKASTTGTATRSLGMSETFYHPRVKDQDGMTNSFQRPGAIKVDGSIEIHRAKQ